MTEYYFVAAALPPLTLGAKPEISFHELRDLFRMNLKEGDLKRFRALLRHLIDLQNIRALWMHLPFDARGNFSPKELEEALLVPDLLPLYVQEYLERYESVADRLRYFSSLFASLFQDMRERTRGFLHSYYIFERELSLVLTALRAKRFGRDLVKELQFEDLDDPLVVSILAQKEAPDYTPPPRVRGGEGDFSGGGRSADTLQELARVQVGSDRRAGEGRDVLDRPSAGVRSPPLDRRGVGDIG